MYIYVFFCLYLFFYFVKVNLLLFFSFEVYDNFESTSDDTIVFVEPKQANPSSHYYIDGSTSNNLII